MNIKHLEFLCDKFKLGKPIGDVMSVHGSRGGSLLWRIEPERGTYAIKQLSPTIDLTNEKIIIKYEQSEMIANQFIQNGIPAISALEKNGKRLTVIENIGYLIYPWIDAHNLSRNEVTESHALKIAAVIANMHTINLLLPEVGEPRFDLCSNDQIIEVIDKSISLNYPFASILKENKHLILSVNDRYKASIPVLKENAVVTHGDLDPLNVLWDKKGNFYLIDWESARRLNATRDIVRTSLSWSSCFSTEILALKNYSDMLSMYIKLGGIFNINDLDAALHSTFGSQIYWLLYNIDLYCSSTINDDNHPAVSEINSVLTSMNKFDGKIPKLLKLSLEH